MSTILLLVAAWGGFLIGLGVGAWWASLRRVMP